ncbi:hypothetical protein GCM10010112_94060 [Actinoplanes lobatus]|uniref:Uncharacterized protein n=1 Tax=Actinoplanes lobatus TaxID=113568 RepID=A0A7W7HEQ4_9ACTN|nr:hypothetical protein [Actinoplanes lobatus]MBB4749170.1 hypothetical protein [Actinoplanes lobatus]GGN99878.1 hypothetical protein GCM10010112_94060 [Actinoplanes lobatus]GIE46446.1 hypothetical protein Alo02nite_93440 [Actinoplanes lobatus]
MRRRSRIGLQPVRRARQPHRGIASHRWRPSEVPGVGACCPLSRENSVHDEDTITTAEQERAEAQAEHQRRAGDR